MINKLLSTFSGTCQHCGQAAGFLKQVHPGCQKVHQDGWNEMTQLAAQAAGTASFNETALRNTLRAIAARARATEDDISQAIAAGWAQGVQNAMSDGILTQEEETNLRDFRDRMANQDLPGIVTGSATLDRASADRISTQAGRAALATGDGGAALQELDNTLRRTSMSNTDRRQLLVRAWETAVEKTLEDGLLSLDEESALHEYLDHFGLTQEDLNANGAQTTLVQAAVIREVTQGIIPQRQNIQGRVPFNLMKSEQLVWVIQGVDYLETVVRRERQGTSHGVSIRVAKGLYYSPRQFRSRPIEWEGNGPGRYRHAGTDDQAHLLRRQPEEVPGALRPHRELRPIRRRLRPHARCPDRQAPDVPHRGRLVPIQPGCQPGPDAELNPLLPSSPHTAHQRQPTIPDRGRPPRGNNIPRETTSKPQP